MSYELLHRGPDRADPEALDADPRGRSRRPVPGKRTLSEALEPAVQLVQRRVRAAAPEADPGRIQAAAQRGIAGPAERLPHLDRIQRLFGRHDVGAVQAHLGEGAAAASDAMGAAAYATGNHIAFGGAPDLHTAAHEAAHVVQQRAGIHLKGGVGESHDEHERHADAVADLVVAGQSAEGLLDRYRSPGAAALAVQRAVKAQKPTTTEVKTCNTLGSLAGVFSLDPGGVRAFGAQMKTRMFATAVFPQPYKDQFDTNSAVKEEVETIIKGLNDLIAASTSDTVIAVAANQGAALADALFGIIGGGITADYVRGKDTPHYKMLALGLAGAGATSYLTFVQTKRAKLAQYKAAIHEDRFDAESRSTNALNQNRIDELTAKAVEIESELTTVLTEHGNLNATLAKVTAFQADIAAIEAAIDLDFKVDDRAIQNQLRTLQRDDTAHNSYREGGGVEDGAAVSDRYQVGMACSLFALLAVVPGFMGASSAPELHKILRKTEKLKKYDEDAEVAQIRLLAGLTPTMEGGRQLGAIIQDILDAGDARPGFIADPTGHAHTFAVVWVDDAYRPKDNGESDSRTDIMNTRAFKEKAIGVTWRR